MENPIANKEPFTAFQTKGAPASKRIGKRGKPPPKEAALALTSDITSAASGHSPPTVPIAQSVSKRTPPSSSKKFFSAIFRFDATFQRQSKAAACQSHKLERTAVYKSECGTFYDLRNYSAGGKDGKQSKPVGANHQQASRLRFYAINRWKTSDRLRRGGNRRSPLSLRQPVTGLHSGSFTCWCQEAARHSPKGWGPRRTPAPRPRFLVSAPRQPSPRCVQKWTIEFLQ